VAKTKNAKRYPLKVFTKSEKKTKGKNNKGREGYAKDNQTRSTKMENQAWEKIRTHNLGREVLKRSQDNNKG